MKNIYLKFLKKQKKVFKKGKKILKIKKKLNLKQF